MQHWGGTKEDISADNLVKIMLDSTEGWDLVNKYVNEVLKAKEEVGGRKKERTRNYNKYTY